MNIDKPLDEIVAANKKTRGPRNARKGATGVPANAPRAPASNQQNGGARARYAGAAPQARNQALPGLENVVGDKIIVSGLPTDVTEAQIKELFQGTIGPLTSVSVAYTAKGISTGTATVLFVKPQDATKAYQQYNKRLIDGKRVLKVEIIVDPTRVPAASLGSRLGAVPTILNAPRQPRAAVTAAAANAAPRERGEGGARRGRGGRAPRVQRPKATLESLDAEMADYQAGSAPAAAAAAPVEV